jgi:hypothetical protein
MATQTETLAVPASQPFSISQKNAAEVLGMGGMTVPRNVRTELSYYTNPLPSAPVYIKDEKSRSKQKQVFQPATIYDVRLSGAYHTLDVSGIQFVNHESQLTVDDFDDDERIKGAYYKEIEEVLRNL